VTILDRFSSCPESGISPVDSLALRRGGLDDYIALSRFHYRAAPPATVCSVLTLGEGEGAVACVVVSRPTLNAWWRRAAWPELHRDSRREAAEVLNAEVRTISRVVVDPRYRGIGLAVRLVREYIDAPLTRYTEAVAVLGRACPFFARAGMTAHQRPACRRDVVLRRAVARLGLRPLALLHPPRALVPALRSWANDSRATRGLDDRSIARAAARALLWPTIAYTCPPIRGPAAEGERWSSGLPTSARPRICTG
jgi:GNAT superfamily N-acetyltransferase